MNDGTEADLTWRGVSLMDMESLLYMNVRVADNKSQIKSPEVQPVTGRAGCGCGIAKLGGLCTKFGESRRDAQISLQASSQM